MRFRKFLKPYKTRGSSLREHTAYIEGCNVTFPQTQTIIDGVVINGRLEKIMQRNLTER